MNNKLMVVLLLALGCSQAVADWVKISANEKSVIYMDSSVSQKVGANVMIWLLRDHSSPQNDGPAPSLSSKDQIEVDCKGQRIRRIFSSAHSRHMGEGKLVNSEHGPMSWNQVAPGTILQRVVDIACVR